MAAKMKVKRKGRIPTKYTLHSKEMTKIGRIVESDIQRKVRAGQTPTGGAQTANEQSTVMAKGHATPLISGRTRKHRFVDTRWDMHPGAGVVKLSLPQHGNSPSAWAVARWLTVEGKYKPIMSISRDANREVLQFVVFTMRKMIAKQARASSGKRA